MIQTCTPDPTYCSDTGAVESTPTVLARVAQRPSASSVLVAQAQAGRWRCAQCGDGFPIDACARMQLTGTTRLFGLTKPMASDKQKNSGVWSAAGVVWSPSAELTVASKGGKGERLVSSGEALIIPGQRSFDLVEKKLRRPIENVGMHTCILLLATADLFRSEHATLSPITPSASTPSQASGQSARIGSLTIRLDTPRRTDAIYRSFA
jgi:hypothetical protein